MSRALARAVCKPSKLTSATFEPYTLLLQGYKINPEAVYFVEGAAQGGTGANWGDGFSTASSVIGNPGGGADPTRFFKTLLTKPYRWAPTDVTSLTPLTPMCVHAQ